MSFAAESTLRHAMAFGSAFGAVPLASSGPVGWPGRLTALDTFGGRNIPKVELEDVVASAALLDARN